MIISLSGKKRSGKSTLASHLVNHYGFVEISWAEPLKEVIGKQLFGLTQEQLYGTAEQKEAIIPCWEKSSRQILQEVGTDMFRSWDPEFWVKIGIKKMDALQLGGTQDIVFSDTRFPNELKALIKYGAHGRNHPDPFHAVYVSRKGLEESDSHESEKSLDVYDFDQYITAGDGEFDSLYSQIKDVVNAVQTDR